jgi:tetratricopeptide (TPR) repeat protein/V8-like Glu-specific endopeptidase
MNQHKAVALFTWMWLWIGSGMTVGALALQSDAVLALSAVEVGKIAKSVTVSIDSEKSVGSGIVIKKEGNTYTVLTAAHVIRDRKQSYKITTPDGKSYPLVATNIKSASSEVDLAVVKFQSSANYPLAKLGKVESVSEGSPVYVAGFPKATAAISTSIYNFTEGKVTANASLPLNGGYSLVYSNSTLPGMSGGPVFNEAGETIAIHGRGDVQESTTTSEINSNVQVKTGFNLGIPTNTFLQLATKLGVNLGDSTPQIATVAPKPPQAADYFLIGVDRFNRGNLGGAIESMNSAIKLNPGYTRAYIARAAANYMFKRIGAALSDVDAAIASDPQSAIAYTGKCFFTSEFGKVGEALGACDRALELNPKLAMAYNVRGLVRTRLNNYAGAIGDLQQAIALDPKLYYSYTNLAIAQVGQRNILGALSSARTATRLNPQSSNARSLLGQLLVLNKDYQQALSELNRAIGLNPRNSSAYEARAAANLALGRTGQAQSDAQRAKQFALGSPEGFIEDISFLNQ